jgi:hypothetical protein
MLKLQSKILEALDENLKVNYTVQIQHVEELLMGNMSLKQFIGRYPEYYRDPFA